MMFRLILTLSLFGSCTSMALAEAPWSRFHGLDGHGYASGVIPSSWTDADYAWRHALDSRDVGSPIVWENYVYLLVSKPESDEISLTSLDLLSGEVRWSRSYPHRTHRVHGRNTLASSTPAADDQYVYIAFAEPDHTYLKCLNHDGVEIWSRDFGRWQAQHGFGTSPRIVRSMVVLMNSQQAERLSPGTTPGQSRMIAADRQTGETIWEQELSTTRTCYGVPATYTTGDGSVQLIGANTGDGIFALDATSGRMLWNVKAFDKRCCSSPLVVGDVAIGTCGSGGGGNQLVAVQIPGAAGQQPSELYRIERAAPYVPTPAVRGSLMYTIDDKGIASCFDWKSGKAIWSKRIGGNFGASPIIVGDKLLLISLDGQATVLRASDRFERLGEVDLGGPVGATPAYSGGRLLIRVDQELRCLAKSPPAA